MVTTPHTTTTAVDANLPIPFIRHVACNLYEMLLLIGVVALGWLVPYLLIGFIFSASPPGWLAMIHGFLVIGAYFVWYWHKSSQTLAMQTWKIRVVNLDGSLLTREKAALRYALSWLWMLPAILVDYVFNIQGSSQLMPLFLFGIFFWPVTALLSPNKSTIHDRLTRTHLVQA